MRRNESTKAALSWGRYVGCNGACVRSKTQMSANQDEIRLRCTSAICGLISDSVGFSCAGSRRAVRKVTTHILRDAWPSNRSFRAQPDPCIGRLRRATRMHAADDIFDALHAHAGRATDSAIRALSGLPRDPSEDLLPAAYRGTQSRVAGPERPNKVKFNIRRITGRKRRLRFRLRTSRIDRSRV